MESECQRSFLPPYKIQSQSHSLVLTEKVHERFDKLSMNGKIPSVLTFFPFVRSMNSGVDPDPVEGRTEYKLSELAVSRFF
jgi:hypothetical protein